MFLQKLNLLFAPPDTPAGSGSAIEDKAMSKEDAITFLGEEDAEAPETLELDKASKKGDKDKQKEDEKDTEAEKEPDVTLEDEIEEELEEPSEDKLELVAPVRKKEILAKYPEIFKDFPYLEKAYYRERAYTEILPTIEDAKVAVEKSERLDVYETNIMNGSTEMLLSAVMNTDKEAFNKVVDNYLPTLYKVDQAAYYHTCGNVIKNAIMAMVRDGKANENDDLMGAADILNQYMFGSKQFTPPTPLAKANTQQKEDDSVSKREQEFTQRQYESALDSITTKTDSILKATIEKHIDTNETMTEYVRKHATSEAYSELEKAIQADNRFTTILDKLWEKAFSDNFSSESMGRIKDAYLSKAKTLLPAIIQKSRNQALKGMGKRVKEDTEDTTRKDRRGPLPVGKPGVKSTSPQSGSKSIKEAAKAIPRGTSSYDYLSQD